MCRESSDARTCMFGHSCLLQALESTCKCHTQAWLNQSCCKHSKTLKILFVLSHSHLPLATNLPSFHYVQLNPLVRFGFCCLAVHCTHACLIEICAVFSSWGRLLHAVSNCSSVIHTVANPATDNLFDVADPSRVINVQCTWLWADACR